MVSEANESRCFLNTHFGGYEIVELSKALMRKVLVPGSNPKINFINSSIKYDSNEEIKIEGMGRT